MGLFLLLLKELINMFLILSIFLMLTVWLDKTHIKESSLGSVIFWEYNGVLGPKHLRTAVLGHGWDPEVAESCRGPCPHMVAVAGWRSSVGREACGPNHPTRVERKSQEGSGHWSNQERSVHKVHDPKHDNGTLNTFPKILWIHIYPHTRTPSQGENQGRSYLRT